MFQKYKLEIQFINDRIHVITEDLKFEILAQYLDLWSRSKDIREDLLPELDAVMTGELEYNDIDADIVGLAYIKRNKTILELSQVGYSDLELPTEDFKELIIQWLSILEKEDR